MTEQELKDRITALEDVLRDSNGVLEAALGTELDQDGMVETQLSDNILTLANATPPAKGELRGKWKSGGCVIWTNYDPEIDGYKGNVDLAGLLMRNTPDELELAINDIVEAHNAVFTEEGE